MTLEEKKAHVLRCVRLGMDFYRSAILAELSDEEVAELEGDEKFTRRLRVEEAIEEERLLRKHSDAIEEAVTRGNATAIQWKLERLNPERWGRRDEEQQSGEDDREVTVNLIGVSPK